MSREQRVRELILECIQSLQLHPDLEPPMYRSYLSITHGENLNRCGVTVERVCAEWEKRSKRRVQALPSTSIRKDGVRLRYQIGANPVLTVGELRSVAEGLTNRANRAADGKQDYLRWGWVAAERLYAYARATLPTVELSLEEETVTWVNIARLATAIVNACDGAEPPSSALP